MLRDKSNSQKRLHLTIKREREGKGESVNHSGL